jgi:predicted NAD/FAD-binding protein
VFAQRLNLLRPSFLRMLLEIRRFRGEFKRLVRELDDSVEIGDYLDRNGYSHAFRRDFLVPFGAAIWSAAPADFEHFPLRTFVQFFLNHGFLDLSRLLQWNVVKGGSHAYVKALLAQLQGTVHTRAKVVAVRRDAEGVDVVVEGNEAQRFDQVVLACHSDQALSMLADASPEEREVLAALPYQPNDVVLHTDTRLLPRHRQVWSSWNYCVPQEAARRAMLTYDMNILQGLSSSHEFLVSLNPTEDVAGVLGRYAYDHPVYTTRGVSAQARHNEISGPGRRTHFAGAYWGYGFHEDGVESALRVCGEFGRGL